MNPALKGIPLNLSERLRQSVSAHDAVRQGIATHAEKESARRQAADHKRQQDAMLAEPLTPSRHG